MKKLITILVLAVICFYHINPVLATNTHSIDLEKDSSQYLSITDTVSLSVTGDLTIEAWVKIETAPSNSRYTITSKWYYSDGGKKAYLFDYRDNAGTKQLEFFQSNDGVNDQNQFLVDADLGTGVWSHVAVTYDVSDGNATFYVNGSQQGAIQSGGSNAIFNNDKPFEIGARNDGTVSGHRDYFDGLIDEVRVWNDIRTATEISDNYQKELVGNEANLAGYWKLNNDLLDETSNNNDLTNNNSAVFSSDVPFTEEEETFIPQILIY